MDGKGGDEGKSECGERERRRKTFESDEEQVTGV